MTMTAQTIPFEMRVQSDPHWRRAGQGVPNCELFVGRFESRQSDHISKMSKP